MQSKWILAVVLLAGGLLYAQGPEPGSPGPPPHMGGGFGMHAMHEPLGNWWKNSDVAQALGLSDQQRQQLEQSFTEHRLRLIDLQAAVQKEEVKFETLMDADRPDAAQVNAQLDRLQNARTQLMKEFTGMTLSFRQILTPEQWRKLESMRHGRGRGFAHPPMPEGPRPPGE